MHIIERVALISISCLSFMGQDVVMADDSWELKTTNSFLYFFFTCDYKSQHRVSFVLKYVVIYIHTAYINTNLDLPILAIIVLNK